MDIERIQGNSIWIKIKCSTWAEIDTVWTNFGGSWDLVDPTGTVIVSGSLDRGAAGILYVRITPAQSLPLTVGMTYSMVVQIDNATAGYKEERNEDTITISKASLIA